MLNYGERIASNLQDAHRALIKGLEKVSSSSEIDPAR